MANLFHGVAMSRKPAALLLSSLLSVLGCSWRGTRLTPEQAFWNWFQKNEDNLFDFEKDQERVFDRLSAELHKVDPNLTFEFGPKENGRREFTISADGIRKAFPAVEKLYTAAPALPRWKLQRFRQRREPSDISFRGVRVAASGVRVDATRQGEKADIAVFIPGYSEAARETYMGITFLLLDQALGEYDVETRIGKIRAEDTSKAPPKAYPLKELPMRFDQLFATK
jgi:hypothetical protein